MREILLQWECIFCENEKAVCKNKKEPLQIVRNCYNGCIGVKGLYKSELKECVNT